MHEHIPLVFHWAQHRGCRKNGPASSFPLEGAWLHTFLAAAQESGFQSFFIWELIRILLEPKRVCGQFICLLPLALSSTIKPGLQLPPGSSLSTRLAPQVLQLPLEELNPKLPSSGSRAQHLWVPWGHREQRTGFMWAQRYSQHLFSLDQYRVSRQDCLAPYLHDRGYTTWLIFWHSQPLPEDYRPN